MPTRTRFDRNTAKNISTLQRGLVVVQYYASRQDLEGVVFCGSLADVLHNLPMLSFSTGKDEAQYWTWVGQLSQKSESPFASVFNCVFGISDTLLTTLHHGQRMRVFRASDLYLLLKQSNSDAPIILPPDSHLKALLSTIERGLIYIRNICYKISKYDSLTEPDDMNFLVKLTDTLCLLTNLIRDWNPDAEAHFWSNKALILASVPPNYTDQWEYIFH